ncbi:MAG TPA: dATP/dGTP diphosphohydrolase domain-containing protein [Nitrososphaeraceae archaeon]
MEKETGLRFNNGKLRYELIPTDPLEYLAEVYTKGAHKYSKYEGEKGRQYSGKDISIEESIGMRRIYDGADNWRLGLSWRETMAAVKRHIASWEKGQDLDKELGTYHLANSVWGLMTLLEFYKTHPELDDRNLHYLQRRRIGVDIDDVLADFITAYCERFGIKEKPNFWEFDAQFQERYNSIQNDEEFWLGLKTITPPSKLAFEPVAYITSRPEHLRTFTERWLFEINKYPVAPVVFTQEKLAACLKYGVERFIDDRYSTFVHLNKNGVVCYLFDSSHNQYVNVGFRRINKSTINRIL